MPPAPTPIQRPRARRWFFLRGLGIYVLYLLGLFLTYLAGGVAYAAWWLAAEERAWGASFEPMDRLVARFPTRPDSEGARTLDRLAEPLGIGLVTWSTRTDRERFKGFQQFMTALEWSVEDDAPVIPPEVVRFLRSHESEIRAVTAHLTSGAELAWEQDLSTVNTPIPPLLGHRTLQMVLLSHALDLSRRGRALEAHTVLEASWILNRSLLSHPELVSTLIGMAVATMQNAVLRQMPDPPTVWSERLRDRDFRNNLLGNLQVHVHVMGNLARGLKGVQDLPGFDEEPTTKRTFGGLIGRLLFTPYFRLSIANYSERARLEALDLQDRDPCLVLPDLLRGEVTRRVPAWNIIARISLATQFGAWAWAAQATFDSERTRLVLEWRRFGRDATSRPPATSPSAVCRDVIWTIRPLGDGRCVIAPDREPFSAENLRRDWRFTTASGGRRTRS